VKIERISDTQLKFILKDDDLAERNIRLSELSYASDKTQRLFKEIMQYVQEEQFVAENTHLMFEAMRVGVDSLVVVVTKMGDNPLGIAGEQSFNLTPAAKGKCRYKRRSGLINRGNYPREESYSIFSFANLEDMAAGAARLESHYKGKSQVYKMEGRYYLLLINETEDVKTTGSLEKILYEFGQKHTSSGMSASFLSERGSVIISEDAVAKLRTYHSF